VPSPGWRRCARDVSRARGAQGGTAAGTSPGHPAPSQEDPPDLWLHRVDEAESGRKRVERSAQRGLFDPKDHGRVIVGADAHEEGGGDHTARAGVKEDRIFSNEGLGLEYLDNANNEKGLYVPGGCRDKRAQQSRTAISFFNNL